MIIVTGAAGFIGSNLVDRLLADGQTVVGIDNFSTGQRRFLEGALKSGRFTLIEGDLLDEAGMEKWFAGAEAVVHLAANADVRFGTEHPRRDLEQNTIATFNVLEAMAHREPPENRKSSAIPKMTWICGLRWSPESSARQGDWRRMWFKSLLATDCSPADSGFTMGWKK